MSDYTEKQKGFILGARQEVDRLINDLSVVLRDFKSEKVSSNDLIIVRQRALSFLLQSYTLAVCRSYNEEIKKHEEQLERTKK